MNLFTILGVLLLLVNFAQGKSSTGSRLLVVVGAGEEASVKSDFSLYLKDLESRGFSVSISSIKNAELSQFGARLYDHLVLFAPEIKKWEKFNADDIINFVNSGGNALITSTSLSASPIRSLAAELGFEMDPSGYAVYNYFKFDTSINTNNGSKFSVLSNCMKHHLHLGGGPSSEINFHGISHKLSADNELLFPLLSPPASAFSARNESPLKKGTEAGSSGKDLGLVSALQGRNNARIVFSGSLTLFSDKFLAKKANAQFVRELSEWNFQERNVLRIKSVSHHKKGETSQLDLYRIKDEFVYEISIEEHSLEGNWAPFVLKKSDQLQLDITMLDPHIRVNLLPSNSTKGTFVTPPGLRLPDVYGVFSLKVNYERYGYSYLFDKSVVSIVPFRHNEYPRFLSAGYPYYASAFSMMAGLFIFVIIYLYHADTQKDKEKPKSE